MRRNMKMKAIWKGQRFPLENVMRTSKGRYSNILMIMDSNFLKLKSSLSVQSSQNNSSFRVILFSKKIFRA